MDFQEGFDYHHAEPGYVMLTYWIPNEPCLLPGSPSHQIGVAGFVINDKREVIYIYIYITVFFPPFLVTEFYFLMILCCQIYNM